MRQARTGQRFLWKAMNRVPWEPTVCLLTVVFVLTHRQSSKRYAERVTGLLYLEDRSRRISLPLTHRAEMVQSAEGICHQQSCRWSRGLDRAFDPMK